MTSLFLPFIFISVIGNLLVIFVLIRFRQTRSPVNIFIGNMAVADLLSTIFLSWTGLTEEFYQGYPNGPFYCQYGDFFKYTCLLTSTFSLVVLSADRLKKVVLPFVKTLTTRKTMLCCLIIWLLAFGFSTPHAAWRRLGRRKWLDYEEVWCCENTAPGQRPYWIALVAFLCYIPVILMLGFYSIVLCKMKKFQTKLNDSGNPVKAVYRRRIIQMIFVYLLVSLICWAPLQVCVFYRSFFHEKFVRDRRQPEWFSTLKFVQHLFATVNAAINPLIYGVVNETFRKAIMLQFPCLTKFFSSIKLTLPKTRLSARNTIKRFNFPATSHGEEETSRSRPSSLYSLKIVTPSLRVLNRKSNNVSFLDRSESLESNIEIDSL